eukprot:830293_1
MAFVSDDKASIWRSFLKGTATGATEAIICYPTEFIKTQLQLQSRTNPEFKGILDCGMKVVRQHGPLGLYRGLLPLLLGSSGKQAARWTAYTNSSKHFRDSEGNIGLTANMFCGFIAGTSEAILAVTPIETIKTRVTDDLRKGTMKYKNSADAVYKIVRAEGPMGIYRGVAPTIMKQGTNQMVRFPIQTFIVGLMTRGDSEKRKSPVLNGLAGAGAGACSVLLTMPQDTIKTRMQSEEAKKLYNGMVDCAMKIYKQEGITFFYAGTWPRLIRVSLDVGITFFIYPLLNQYF